MILFIYLFYPLLNLCSHLFFETAASSPHFSPSPNHTVDSPVTGPDDPRLALRELNKIMHRLLPMLDELTELSMKQRDFQKRIEVFDK